MKIRIVIICFLLSFLYAIQTQPKQSLEKPNFLSEKLGNEFSFDNFKELDKNSNHFEDIEFEETSRKYIYFIGDFIIKTNLPYAYELTENNEYRIVEPFLLK